MTIFFFNLDSIILKIIEYYKITVSVVRVNVNKLSFYNDDINYINLRYSTDIDKCL